MREHKADGQSNHHQIHHSDEIHDFETRDFGIVMNAAGRKRRNAAARRCFCVRSRVARRAGLRQISFVDGRKRIARKQYFVIAVTARAVGDSLVAERG